MLSQRSVCHITYSPMRPTKSRMHRCTHLANTNVHRSQRKSEDPAKTTYSIFALLSCPYSSRALEAHGLQHVRRQWQEPACDKVRERKNRRSVRVTCSASSWACSQPSWRRRDAPEECICHADVHVVTTRISMRRDRTWRKPLTRFVLIPRMPLRN